MKKLVLFTIVTGVLLGGAQAGFGGDFEDLDFALDNLEDNTHLVIIERLVEGGDRTWTVSVPDGVYIIRGFCDFDCDDIDLCVSSRGQGDWEECDQDDEPYPIVSTGPTDFIRVLVEMWECDARSCIYGIAMERS